MKFFSYFREVSEKGAARNRSGGKFLYFFDQLTYRFCFLFVCQPKLNHPGGFGYKIFVWQTAQTKTAVGFQIDLVCTFSAGYATEILYRFLNRFRQAVPLVNDNFCRFVGERKAEVYLIVLNVESTNGFLFLGEFDNPVWKNISIYRNVCLQMPFLAKFADQILPQRLLIGNQP